MISPGQKLLDEIREDAKRRVRDATNNLEAAKRQFNETPDDDLAYCWLEAAVTEATDAKAVGEELGLTEGTR